MKLMRLVTVFAVTAMTMCGTQKPAVVKPPECQNVIKYQLDPRFDIAQITLILQSMQAWDVGTRGSACFIQGDDGLFVYKTDLQPQQREVELKGAKVSNLSPDSVLGLEEQKDDKTYAVYLLTNKLNNERDFYAVSMHEMGHVLGLDHYDGPDSSWMHPVIGDSPINRVLTKRDMDTYCSIHNCK